MSSSIEELEDSIAQIQKDLASLAERFALLYKELEVERFNYRCDVFRVERELEALRSSQERKITESSEPRWIPMVGIIEKGFHLPEWTSIDELIRFRNELRSWWHMVLWSYGRYSCYAMLLVLPSDEEAIRYWTDFGRELDLISGTNCLVIGMGESELRYFGFDEQVWTAAIYEQAFEGCSRTVAKLFNIDISEFPCLLIFEDIRRPDHVVVSLKDMTAEEISGKMRILFSLISEAIFNKENPLTILQRQQDRDTFLKSGKTMIGELRTFAGKTFQAAIESLIVALMLKQMK